MTARRNKKILCFMDEYGTAGAGELYIGAVMLPAAEAGHVDKIFSDLLEPNAGEVHASALKDSYVEGLLERFRLAAPSSNLVMVNRRVSSAIGTGPEIYANAVVEIVKIMVTLYKKDRGRRDLNNIDLILDQNHHNTSADFDRILAREQEEGGKFRGVNSIAKIDSAAARLLQLADLVASARKFVAPLGSMRADAVRDRFGIDIL